MTNAQDWLNQNYSECGWEEGNESNIGKEKSKVTLLNIGNKKVSRSSRS